MRGWLAAPLGLLLCGALTGGPAAAAGASIDFDIPAQKLSSALTQYARQSGVQIVADAHELGEARTAGARGRMRADAALQRLLRDTPFTAQPVGSGTMAIVARYPASAETPARRVEATGNLDTIVVTGSRQQRSIADSSAPIDVISGDALERLGAATLTEALNQLLPSFNLPAIPGQDQSTIVRPATLRGLDADQTLVLVNGKRRHATAIVNATSLSNKGSQPVYLNFIAFSQVERIEVLRDGAAALYGSDAIAGVVNIILKRNGDGPATLSSKVGGYDFRDGFLWQQTLNKGFSVAGGFVNLSLEYLNQRHTDRSFATLPQNDTGPGGAPAYYWGLDYSAGEPAAYDPREAAAQGQHRVQDGIPDQHGVNLSYNAAVPLTGGTQLYSFSTYSYRVGTGYENFRYANGSRDPTNCPDGSGPRGNPYCQVYPDGYEPHEVITENDFSVTLGLKGGVGRGWHWDLSTTYGKDDASVGVENSLNATLGPSSPTKFYNGSWINAEQTSTLDLSRRFDIGLDAPLNLALGAEHRNNSYAIKPGQNESWWYGPNDICRTDPGAAYCSFTAPDGAQLYPNAGAQSYNGFEPNQSGHDYRDSFAGYVDIETHPLPAWDLGLAGRYEHYDDFGDTRTGKLSTRYQLLPSLALRGTLSNGFRAPSLGQSLYASSTTFFRGGRAIDIVTTPVDSALAGAFGARPLQPEQSSSYSLGFVLQPAAALDLTVDAYRIYVRKRISVSGYLGPDYQTGTDSTGTPVIDYLFPAGVTPRDLQYFGNLVDTRTQGLDAVLNYRTRLDRYGLVRWSLEANWNQTKLTGIAANPAVFSQPLGPDQLSVAQANPGFDNIFDPSQQGYLTVASPRNKIIASANYLYQHWRCRLALTRYGKVVDTTYQDAVQTITPKLIVDLDLSYDVSSWLSLGVGADNLFDTYPPQTTAAYRAQSGPQGFGKYDGFSPYGYFGGFYYGRVIARF